MASGKIILSAKLTKAIMKFLMTYDPRAEANEHVVIVLDSFGEGSISIINQVGVPTVTKGIRRDRITEWTQ